MPTASRIPIHNVKEQVSGIELRISFLTRSPPYLMSSEWPKGPKALVEPTGIEPVTPCLQSRCSPS